MYKGQQECKKLVTNEIECAQQSTVVLLADGAKDLVSTNIENAHETVAVNEK